MVPRFMACLLMIPMLIGVTMIAAALVIPPVIARMLTDRFGRMLLLAVSIGAVSGFTGMYLSYHLDISSGAAVVITQGILFGTAYAATARSRVGDRLAGLSTG